MKSIILILIFLSSLFSSSLNQPALQYKASGSVTDMTINKGKLYVATNASSVDIFDLKTAKKLESILVPRIKDFMGDIIDSKVYSVDVQGDKIAILSQANKGFRRIHIYQRGKLDLLISNKDELYTSKLRFLNENTLILGLLGNEIISYDISKRKINWTVQVSHSKFSDFVLNENKDEIVVADESGDLKILSTNKGSLIDTLSDQNLDNVFQVDYKNGIIATAGQDRRVVVYDIYQPERGTSKENFSAYYKKAPFLIYSVGLSPSGNKVAYASDEDNNVRVFNTKTKETLGDFTGNKMTLSKILFLDEERFLVASDDKVINLFQVK